MWISLSVYRMDVELKLNALEKEHGTLSDVLLTVVSGEYLQITARVPAPVLASHLRNTIGVTEPPPIPPQAA